MIVVLIANYLVFTMKLKAYQITTFSRKVYTIPLSINLLIPINTSKIIAVQTCFNTTIWFKNLLFLHQNTHLFTNLSLK